MDNTAVTATNSETTATTDTAKIIDYSGSVDAGTLDALLADYTNQKTTVALDGVEVEIVHTITLGDMYIMLLLTIVIIVLLLSRFIGRR